MPTFNFRIDSAGTSGNGFAVRYTSGFGALPAAASGRGMEMNTIQQFADLADITRDSLEPVVFGLLLLWLKQAGITNAASVVGHTMSITVTAGTASMSVT